MHQTHSLHKPASVWECRFKRLSENNFTHSTNSSWNACRCCQTQLLMQPKRGSLLSIKSHLYGDIKDWNFTIARKGNKRETDSVTWTYSSLNCTHNTSCAVQIWSSCTFLGKWTSISYLKIPQYVVWSVLFIRNDWCESCSLPCSCLERIRNVYCFVCISKQFC